ITLRDLNAAFTNPQLISMAYFEGSLVVEHIVTVYGQEGLKRFVHAFADGTEMEAALQTALNVTIDKLQASFDDAIAKEFGPLAAALKVPADVKFEGATLDTLQAAAASHPNSYPV